MDEPKKRDLDEPVNINLSPEDALRVLLRGINDPEMNADPPGAGWPGEEPN